MQTILMTLLLMLAAGTLQAATPGFDKLVLADYKKDDNGGWIHNRNKTNVVTANILEDAWFDLTETEAPKYVHKQEEIRSHLNFFAGLTDWSVTKQNYKKDGSKIVLSMQGEFKHGGQTHYFQEKQIFLAPNIYQIKVSSTDRNEVSEEATQKVFESAMAVLQ